MLGRLKTDFQLSIMTLLGASALFGISPFAVYRFLSGEYLVGVTDVAILASIVGTVCYAWLTGDTRRSGALLSTLTCAGGIAVALLLGDRGLFWLYPAFLTTFFLTTAWFAVTINSASLVVLCIEGGAFQTQQELLSFVATSLVVSACAYIFARRNRSQRQILQRLATHDPLTNAGNRRAMEEELMAAIATKDRSGTQFGLIIFDLDHFKRVNDRFGHNTGDSVLAQCADLVRSHTRVVDRLFRFGGEEFVVLMPELGKADVFGVAEKLRRILARELVTPEGPCITASFGAAVLEPRESMDQWLHRADMALYEAKSSGRNRVVVDPGQQTGVTASLGVAAADSSSSSV